jgi:uncharacterized protein YjbJ (UPF0337 family)
MKDKVVGKAEELRGKVTDDKPEELKGKARQAKGDVKRGGQHLRDDVDDLTRRDEAAPPRR